MRAITAAALSLLISGLLGGCGGPARWQVVPNPGRAIMGMDNTHAAAAAWLVRYYDPQAAQRSEKQLVAGMRLHVGVPKCPSCPELASWDIERGLKSYFIAHGQPQVQTRELYRYPDRSVPPGAFADYVRSIDAGRPVVLTFCYDPAHRTDAGAARLRARRCFSVVGIGYVRYRGLDYFICHDGLTGHLEDGIDTIDRIQPVDAGLEGIAGPWQQAGTSLYRWDGQYANLIMVFFSPPAAVS